MDCTCIYFRFWEPDTARYSNGYSESEFNKSILTTTNPNRTILRIIHIIFEINISEISRQSYQTCQLMCKTFWRTLPFTIFFYLCDTQRHILRIISFTFCLSISVFGLCIRSRNLFINPMEHQSCQRSINLCIGSIVFVALVEQTFDVIVNHSNRTLIEPNTSYTIHDKHWFYANNIFISG